MKRNLHIVFFIILIAASGQMQAQIVGSNCFLKGTYVEVGINQCGVYGSVTPPPTGYHPNAGGLGFVADSDMDGWTTGSPKYCGDYFVPGAPVEGWQVQIGSDVYTNTDNGCYSDEIPGDVTSYAFVDNVYTAEWEGDIVAHDLHITQTTTLPLDSLFFVTRVLLCNEGTDPIDDVYYERNVDPDQESMLGGGAVTYNEVILNPPADADALVISEGTLYGCFLGIGARDPNARVTYGHFSTTDGIPSNIWAGSGGYYLSGDETNDIANQVTIYVEKIDPGTCACVAFAYILNEEDLESALDATLAAVTVTADEVDITTSGLVSMCPFDTTTLEIVNGEGYDWTWTPSIGLSSDTGYTVQAFPDETTVYTVSGSNECGAVIKEITVEIYTPPVADAGEDIGSCPDSTVTLHGTGGTSYDWQPNVYLDDNTSPDPDVTILTDMYYFLEVTDDHGCKDTDQVYVQLYEVPDVQAGADKIMTLNTFTQLFADGALTYVWTPAETLSDSSVYNPYAYPDDTTTYYVTGTDEHLCRATDSLTVFVIDPVNITSPNIFTPNKDNINDYYIPNVEGIGELQDFQVYNRWGVLVYDWNTTDPGWDGIYDNTPQEVGTYIVVITARDLIKNIDVMKTSNVILMR